MKRDKKIFDLSKEDERSLNKLPKLERILVRRFLEETHNKQERIDNQFEKVRRLQSDIQRKKDNGILLNWNDIICLDNEIDILQNLMADLENLYSKVEVV